MDVLVCEHEMVAPTLTLFPTTEYHHFEQVPFGRKHIDLVCLNRSEPFTITIELKIKDWRQALWQASLNSQVADHSYIAIWHQFVHRAESQSDLLFRYGVGLISVSRLYARVLLSSSDPVRRIARSKKREWYQQLLRTT